MDKDVEHVFIYLLAICTTTFETCVLSSFADFLKGMLVSLVFNESGY
jgi:sarcosine oxidase gamma subunit